MFFTQKPALFGLRKAKVRSFAGRRLEPLKPAFCFSKLLNRGLKNRVNRQNCWVGVKGMVYSSIMFLIQGLKNREVF